MDSNPCDYSVLTDLTEMINLNLNPELEQRIQEKANLEGLSTEQYIQNLIEETLTNLSQKSSSALEDEDWEGKLRKFINRPSNINMQPLSDEAISRESIDSREDKML